MATQPYVLYTGRSWRQLACISSFVRACGQEFGSASVGVKLTFYDLPQSKSIRGGLVEQVTVYLGLAVPDTFCPSVISVWCLISSVWINNSMPPAGQL